MAAAENQSVLKIPHPVIISWPTQLCMSWLLCFIVPKLCEKLNCGFRDAVIIDSVMEYGKGLVFHEESKEFRFLPSEGRWHKAEDVPLLVSFSWHRPANGQAQAGS